MPELAEILREALQERYVLEDEIGRGGMAVVFLARDLRHDRPVAIKVLRPEIAAVLGPERFLHEIRLTARLNHPLVLPLLDSGQISSPGQPPLLYYVMPFVEGESLRDRLAREGPLPVPEAVRITAEVADALAYLHAQGIVHRDIKPDNILLSGGHAVIADLGIGRVLEAVPAGRLTETGVVLGTAAYMSPEQAMGDARLDARADIYALGCVLYELLAGEPPLGGPTAQAIVARRLTEPVPSLTGLREVSTTLEHTVRRALARAPADRHQTAREFAQALQSGAGEAAAPPTGIPPITPGRRSRPIAWLAGAFAALAILLAAVLWMRGRGSGAPMPAVAGSIAVLPFVPSSGDTALLRLGRDLSATVSASLDGVGNLHTLDRLTVLARWPEQGSGRSLKEDAALARRLGAASLVQGSLVRSGDQVRLDFSLTSTDSLSQLARGTWTGPPDINAMTDSITRSLLRQVWREGAAPTPSLDAALRTRSVPSLRAFLQGEQDVSRGRWDDAVQSYRRALGEDSSFYLAGSRLLLALYWSQDEGDTALETVMRGHLTDLPPRERLLTRAYLEHGDSVSASLGTAAQLVRRYPDFWPGWLYYGDWLFHDGPAVGRPIAQSGDAFERALALDPGLLPAWDHLGLLTAREADLPGLQRVLHNLDSLHARAVLAADGYGDHVLLLQLAERELAGDSSAVRVLVDSAALDYRRRSATASFFDPMEFRHFATQVQVYRAAAQLAPTGRNRNSVMAGWDETADPAYWPSRAWMGRGAWDSALVMLDRGYSGDALVRDRVAVLAAVVGARDPASVTLHPAEADSSDRAELAWLAGILAWQRGDRQALLAASRRLDSLPGTGRAAFQRSLKAHQLQLDGSAGEAGGDLAALEFELAEQGDQNAPSPLLPQVDRLHAADWLLATGDTATAERLLNWGDAVFQVTEAASYTIPLTPLFDLARARIETQRDAADPAVQYYRLFLQAYDAPAPALAHLVDEARTALKRLGHAP